MQKFKKKYIDISEAQLIVSTDIIMLHFVIILAGSAQQLVSLNIFQGKLVLFLTNLLYAQIHHFEQ